MLALATTDALVLLDAPTLKHPTSSTSSCQSLIDSPTSSTWSPDNTTLFLASAAAIHKYDPSTNSLQCIYSTTGPAPIRNLIAKDKGNVLIFSVSQGVQVFDCGSGKVVQTFNTHKSTVTSLALSNDCTLLASTSIGIVHVHNLTLGSHTVLRGLPSTITSINVCVFHAHTRTRLLIGAGRQLLVYDTTRPSSPVKVISMSDSSTGEIAFLACSPFSKTLVAFATNSGHVTLVDLEKEKSIIRTINVNVQLTSLAFSQEGAAVYMGTENGKLLIIDLRALDKPQKVISVGETGSRVETISVQKKLRAGVEPSAKSTISAKSSTQPDTARKTPAAIAPTKAPAAKPISRSSSKAVGIKSPVQSRARNTTVATPPSRDKRKNILPSPGPVKQITPSRGKPPSAEMKKNALSPARDPLGNSGCGGDDISVCLDNIGIKTRGLGEVDGPTVVLRTRVSVSPKVSKISTSGSTLDVPSARNRSRSVSITSRTTATSSKSSSEVTSARGSVRTASTVSSVSARSGNMPYSRSGSSISRAGSPYPPFPADLTEKTAGSAAPSGTGTKLNRVTKAGPRTDTAESRTPSPDLPDIDLDTCPLPAVNAKIKEAGLNVLGLGTPEVDRWIAAGRGIDTRKEERKRGKGKVVAFEGTESGDEAQLQAQPKEAEHNLAVQVSPRRPVADESAAAQWTMSPLRHLEVDPNTPSVSSAQDLLRTIIRDVMYDFRQETRTEMVGLHLDLVRMGRGWRRELRGLMDEYVGDLRDLREENTRLREENERLRRSG